jgi:hypothetical protein
MTQKWPLPTMQNGPLRSAVRQCPWVYEKPPSIFENHKKKPQLERGGRGFLRRLTEAGEAPVPA